MKLFNSILMVIVFGVCISFTGCATVNKSGDERVRLKEPRIKPLAESEWNAEQQKLLNTRKSADGRIINIYTTIAHHPKMAEKWLTFADYILR